MMPVGLGSILSLILGVALVLVGAWLATRLSSRARFQRGVWQTAIVVVLGLVVVEWSGLGSYAIVWRHSLMDRGQTGPDHPTSGRSFPASDDAPPSAETSPEPQTAEPKAAPAPIAVPQTEPSPFPPPNRDGRLDPPPSDLASDERPLGGKWRPFPLAGGKWRVSPSGSVREQDSNFQASPVREHRVAEPETLTSSSRRSIASTGEKPFDWLGGEKDAIPLGPKPSPTPPTVTTADAALRSTARPETAIDERSGVPVPSSGDVNRESAANTASGESGAATAGARNVAPAVRWFLVVWIVGMALGLVRVGFARWRLRCAARSAERDDSAAIRGAVEALQARLGWTRPVRIVRLQTVQTPVAFGLLHPQLGLPADFPRTRLDLRHRAILAHELAHLAGGDSWWHLLADVLGAILWWYPAMWLIRGGWRFASEAAADEAASILPGGAEALAEGLVGYGKRLHRHGLVWQAAGGPGYRSSLGRRVDRLLKLRSEARASEPITARHFRSRRTSRLAISGMCVVAVLFGTAWVRPEPVVPFPGGEQTMKGLSLTWRQSLTAAAVAAFLMPLAGHATADEPPRPDGVAEAVVDEEHAPDAAPEEVVLRDEEGEDRDEGREDHERHEHPDAQRRDRERDEEGEHREPPEAAARNRARAELFERAEQRLRELSGQLEEVARHAEELRHATEENRERPDVRERLERELQAAEARMGALEHEKNSIRMRLERAERVRPERPEGMPAMERLHRRLAELERQLVEARKAGREGAVAELEREMAKVREMIERHPGEPRPPEGLPMVERVERRLDEIRRQMAEAREAGRAERAELLEREARELREMMERRLAERPPAVQRAADQLLEAARVLEQTGNPDLAEELRRRAHELMERGPEPRPVPPPRPGTLREPEGPPPMEAVREMHAQMEEMRAQMRQMREVMERMMRRLEELERR